MAEKVTFPAGIDGFAIVTTKGSGRNTCAEVSFYGDGMNDHRWTLEFPRVYARLLGQHLVKITDPGYRPPPDPPPTLCKWCGQTITFDDEYDCWCDATDGDCCDGNADDETNEEGTHEPQRGGR